MELKKYKNWAYASILIWIVLLLMLIYNSINTWFDVNNNAFVLCWILMVVCFFFWIRNLLKRTRVKKMGQELTQNGKKIEARVLLILRIPYMKYKRLSYKYKIVAKYMKETFCSEEYSTKLSNVIKKWDEIDVYIDEEDHSKYWMDVDSLFGKKCEIIQE